MRRRTLADKAREWGRGDLEAARAVLESPDKYGGKRSGIVTWARRVVARAVEGDPEGVMSISKPLKIRTVGHPSTNLTVPRAYAKNTEV